MQDLVIEYGRRLLKQFAASAAMSFFTSRALSSHPFVVALHNSNYTHHFQPVKYILCAATKYVLHN